MGGIFLEKMDEETLVLCLKRGFAWWPRHGFWPATESPTENSPCRDGQPLVLVCLMFVSDVVTDTMKFQHKKCRQTRKTHTPQLQIEDATLSDPWR